MLFMNEFLKQHWDGMRGFLQTVSNVDTEIPMTSFDGYVDLPLRLAVLHGLLVDIIYQKDQVGWKTNWPSLIVICKVLEKFTVLIFCLCFIQCSQHTTDPITRKLKVSFLCP